MIAPLDRLRRSIATHGVAQTARLTVGRLKPPPPLDAELIWYRMDLHAERAEYPLEEGREVRPMTETDIPLLEQLPGDPATTPYRAHIMRERMAAGGTPWGLVQDGRVAFACWIFPTRAPVEGAARGWLELEEGFAVIEDSIAAPDARGRGVAAQAVAAVCRAVADDGFRHLLTKVGSENVVSQRAVRKLGFAEVARMRNRRRGWRWRVRLELRSDDPGLAWLSRLERG